MLTRLVVSIIYTTGVIHAARLLPSPIGSGLGGGSWGNWHYCTEGTYLLGMYARSTPLQSEDNGPIGITQLKLHCGKSDGVGLRVVLKNLTSGIDSYQPKSVQTPIKYCKQYAIGFNLKNLNLNESLTHRAGRKSLGIRLHCGGSPIIHLDGGMDDLGSYQTTGTNCSPGEFLCGARMKIEYVEDVKIITNVDGQCCTEQVVSKFCTPMEEWISAFEYNNLESNSVMDVSFSAKSYARWAVEEENENLTQDLTAKHRSIPITGTTAFINNLIDPLVSRFGKELGQHGEFIYDWGKITKVRWLEERINNFIATVEPHSFLQVEQLIGRCGVVEALADSFRISVKSEPEFGGPIFYLSLIGILVVVFAGVIAFLVYTYAEKIAVLHKQMERQLRNSSGEQETFLQTESGKNLHRY